jgi:hypothetical protein
MYAELDGIGTDAELETVIAVLERVVAGHLVGDPIAVRVAGGERTELYVSMRPNQSPSFGRRPEDLSRRVEAGILASGWRIR